MPKFTGYSTLLILCGLYGCQSQPLPRENMRDEAGQIAVAPCSKNATEACQVMPDKHTAPKIKRSYTDKQGCQYTEYENGLADAACPQ